MNAAYEILFREIVGAGDDEEGTRHENGIVVTLSYWQTMNNDWKVSNHYLLEAKVMIKRELVVNEITFTRAPFTEHSKYIRQAIARMDQLQQLNPEVEVVQL